MCDHTLGYHARQGHSIDPLPREVGLKQVFDLISERKKEITQLSNLIIDEVQRMTLYKLDRLNELRKKVTQLDKVNSATVDQTRDLIDAIKAPKHHLDNILDSMKKATKDSRPVVVSGSWDNTIRVWKDGTARVLEGHINEVRSVAVSSKKEFVASGSLDKTIRLWSLSTGLQTQVLKGHDGLVSSIAISKDDQFLVSGSRDNTLRVWSLGCGLGTFGF